jgi:hypothetical protein
MFQANITQTLNWNSKMKNLVYVLTITASLLSAGVTSALAESNTCIPVGGTALGQFFNDGKDVVGAMSGTWSATRGTVVSQKKTATGLELGMQHAFSTAEGGVVTTRDEVTLTAMPGETDGYGLDIAYTVVNSFGHLKGYAGTFYSYGRINTGTGEAVVRYRGQLCK